MALRFLNSGYFAGKVGIGTESPTETLHVGDNSIDAVVRTTYTDGSYVDIHGYGIVMSRTASYIKPLNDGTQALYLGDANAGSTWNSVQINAETNVWKKDATEFMRLNSSGNLGIGTDSPDSLLHIKGADPVFIIQDTSTGTVNASSTLRLGESGAGGVLDVYWDIKQAADNLNTHLEINHSANGNHLTILDDGKVGIGTTNPAQNFVVADATNGNGVELVPGATATIQTYNRGTSTYTNLNIDTLETRVRSFGATIFNNGSGLSESMRVTSGGDVGINTTLPDFKLDVDGTFGVSDLPGNSTSVSVLVADEITGVELVTNGDFSNGQTGWSFQTGWAVSNGGATVSTAGVTSRVSQTLSYVANISTTTKFRYKFEITNITAGSLRLFVNKPAFTEIANVNAVGKYEYDVEVSTGSNGIFYLYSTNSGGNTFQGTVTNVSVKEITPVSNQIQKRELGTGAFGPTPVGAYLPLSAGSGSPLTGDLYIEEDSLYLLNASNNYWRVQNNSSGKLTFKQGTTQRGIWSSGELQLANDLIVDGSVGIGTTSVTAAKLVVSSNTGPQLLIKCPSGGSSAAQILFEHNSGGTQNASITFDQSSQNTLTIATGYQSPTDLNRINISPAGNVGLTVRGGTGGSGLGQPLVGIGTTTPTEKLEVVGNVKIDSALLSNQENTDVDTGTEAIASVVLATYTAAFFDFVIKKGTNVRSGTVYACHDGTSVAFTETSTNDLGDTSDVTLNVVISTIYLQLQATTTSDDWIIKSLIRAI